MMDAIEFLKQCRAVHPTAQMSVDVRPVDKIVISWEWTVKGQTYGLGGTFDRNMLNDPSWVDAAIQDLQHRVSALN
ncbi:hypothetical protein [Serratia fonticola]|uniref:hypothetical protein n=1 Tax=Serratia fonticola TaxID=47917 RepID=UPI0015C5CAE8|nr:hypothetical protein [Serratia fonticola]NYA16527.1 hypothetical protein [Serratia fonticola]NYA36650.1 hypothetical protein [Serratia fonticola]